MERSFLHILSLSATLTWCAGPLAQDVPTTQAPLVTEEWAHVTVPELQVRFSKPKDWQIVLGPVRDDVTAPGVRGFHIKIERGTDDTFTIVGLHRTPTTRPARGDAAQRVQEMLEYRRDAVAKNRLTLVEDVALKVAGCPGWILTTDYDKRDPVMRVTSIFFVSGDAEFRATLGGQVDSVIAARPNVMRLLHSLELSPPQAKD